MVLHLRHLIVMENIAYSNIKMGVSEHICKKSRATGRSANMNEASSEGCALKAFLILSVPGSLNLRLQSGLLDLCGLVSQYDVQPC